MGGAPARLRGRRLHGRPLLGFDSYFLPDLQRYSENGVVKPAWVYGLTGAAAVAGLWTLRAPRSGLRATALVMFVVLLTTMLIPSGH